MVVFNHQYICKHYFRHRFFGKIKKEIFVNKEDSSTICASVSVHRTIFRMWLSLFLYVTHHASPYSRNSIWNKIKSIPLLFMPLLVWEKSTKELEEDKSFNLSFSVQLREKRDKLSLSCLEIGRRKRSLQHKTPLHQRHCSNIEHRNKCPPVFDLPPQYAV